MKAAIPYKISFSGLSDVGLVRDNNEDFWKELSAFNLFVLADGMGGHQAGEIAAQKAVNSLCDIIRNQASIKKLSLRDAYHHIREAIELTNRIVHQMGRSHYGLKGMGTTLCCLYFHPDGVIYGNVGDSRVYRLRSKVLEQLTIDHSLFADLEINNSLEDLNCKNIITKAIGTEAEVDPAVHECDISAKDIFMMCSDGLTDLLSNQEIETIINTSPSLEEATSVLVEEAKRRGGHDNITVVLTEVVQ